MKGHKKKKHEKVLIIDVYNLMFRTVNYAFKDSPIPKLQNSLLLTTDEKEINKINEEISKQESIHFGFFKYLFVTNIQMFARKFRPTKLIMAIDTDNYWRKDIYPEYKGKRKAARQKSAVPYEKFWPIFNPFIKEFEDVLSNVYFLSKPRCEADDFIGVLCKEEFSNVEFINVSTDGDFHQLGQHPNYKQYNPMTKKMVTNINPKKDLFIKILMGDSGDNIPGVKDRCGVVTATKMVNEGLDKAFEDESVKANFDRNKQLIDLSMVPQKYKDEILECYRNYPITPFKKRNVWNFMLNHRLKNIAENINEFSSLFENLD